MCLAMGNITNEVDNILLIMNAVKAGKDIEVYDYDLKCYCEFDKEKETIADLLDYIASGVDVRIKPSPVYREYKSADEFSTAMNEHGPWLINKSGKRYLPTFISNYATRLCGVEIEYMSLLDSNYTWQDGSRCGIVI